MISKEQIKELANKFFIDEFTVAREYIQLVFLGILYNLKDSQQIYFKGGTVLRLIFGSRRFSEDLDFTSQLSLKATEAVLRNTVKKMGSIIPDVSLKHIKRFPSSLRTTLSYRSGSMKYPLNLRIDFSVREKPLSQKETVLKTDYPLSFHPVLVHLTQEEILAEKARAFLYRAKGRDVYDLWFMLSKGIKLDWRMINQKLKTYQMKADINKLITKTREFEQDRLRNDLGQFLSLRDRRIIPHLKELLLKELLDAEEKLIKTDAGQ